jgi:3-oxoadipate enol-lactonase
MPTIQVNNAQFYYELHGKGQPLVLVSGLGADHQAWLSILEPLAKQYRVLIFDNRAVGRTRDNGISLTIDQMADDVAALATALNLHNPHFVGHSMGGCIVQSIAARYADKIGKVALLTTSPKWRQAMLLAMKMIATLREKVPDPKVAIQSVMMWCLGEQFLQQPGRARGFVEMFLVNPHPQLLVDYLRQVAALEAFDGRERLHQITAPTLVVYGKEDLLSLPHESEYLARQIPHSTLVSLSCAHIPGLEVPAELAQVLLKFLA